VKTLTLALTIAGIACAQTQVRPPVVLPSYKNLKYAPLPPLNPPKPAEVTLPNGMKVFLLEDHELPVVSGFGKRGIGACSETREQFHEFGAQSIAARRGERVKRKKRHVGVLGQHVILRRNFPPVPAILRPAGDTITPLLALKSKKTLGPPTRCWFRYRGKKRSLCAAHSDYL